jgi:ribosome maturation factor RimP
VQVASEIKEKLLSLIGDISDREGLRLYDLEFSGSRSRVVRVLIDRKDGPVSVEDCANVSRALNLLLDIEDLIPGGAYDLEVSSPGLERKLTQRWHYEQAKGQRVKVQSQNSKKWVKGNAEVGANLLTLEGDLFQVDENGIELTDNEKACRIQWFEIERAQRVFRPVAPGKKKR